MPSVTAQSLISQTKALIQDPDNDRWQDYEHLLALNEGQRVIASVKPDACSTVTTHTLVAGTRQTLPSNGVALIRAIRNVDGAGAPGRAVYATTLDLLTSSTPGWHAATPTGTVYCAAVDPAVPRVFYVSPPVTEGVKVDLHYAIVPATVRQQEDVISIDDLYAGALVDFMCFRAYCKDQDLAGASPKAQMHLQLFNLAVGARIEGGK
jgi:hypothetical protein